MTTQVMRPSILVALKTSVYGGVNYERRDIEQSDDGKMVSWETKRTMQDPEEHKAASEAARIASSLVSRLCVRTGFGLLCPLDKEAALDLAVAAARINVETWNASAEHTYISVNAIMGRIADDDEEAIRSLLAEASDLVRRMDNGLASADAEAIRAAANRALRLVEMMGDDAAASISEAVTAARKAAREVVRRLDKEGQSAERVIREVNRESFDRARFAFLDTVDAKLSALPAIDLQRMAEIDAYRASATSRKCQRCGADFDHTGRGRGRPPLNCEPCRSTTGDSDNEEK